MPPSFLTAADRGAGVPSPAPSTGSAGSAVKRKREDMPVFSQPRSSGAGRELLSQAKHAVDYLKDRHPRVERTFDEIVSYLSLQHNDPEQLLRFKKVLQSGTLKITYNPRGKSGAGTYKYRPVLPIESEEDLKAYLQRQVSSVGVRMEELKDGWEKCNEALDQMEKRHELLIIRDKKGTIRTVWQDDSSLAQNIQPDFQRLWHHVALPPNDNDLRSELVKAGLKPSTAPKETRTAAPTVKQKKRQRATRGKHTNVHMLGILKDYSHKRYENN